MKRRFFFLVTALLSGVCVGQASPWRRADVYLVDWEMDTRVALTPDMVRKFADSKRTHRDDVVEVVRVLALDKLKPARNSQPEDARLVVDLFDDKGARTTYYASQFHLCTADSTAKHSVSWLFRRRVGRLFK